MSNQSYPPPGEQYGAPGQGGPGYGQPQGDQPQYGQQYSGQPMYASDQAQGGRYAPAAVTRPATIDRAVMLMKVGAALSIISGLLSLVMKDAYRDIMQKSFADSNVNVTAADIDSATNAAVVMGVVSGLIGAALWWWMAVMNGKGKSWARVLSTIFFAISLLSFVNTLRTGAPALAMILSVASILVGAAAIYFLWQKASSEYYEAANRKL